MSRWPIVIITLAALLAHAPGLGNGYVWDDRDVVLGAYDGDAPRPWTDLLLAPDANASDPHTPYYRPLTRVSFAIDRALWGDAPAPRHAENIALHAAAALLAFLVLRRLVDPRVALAAALLFAVHPVQAETVNELFARNTVLAAALALGALLAHLAWRERGGRWRLVACGACYFLGLVSKETAAPIVIVAALLDWASPPSRVRPWRTRLAGLAPFAVALAIYLPLRFAALGALAPPAERAASLGTRLLQQLWIVPQYLATAAWPAGLDAARRVPATALSAPWLVPAWLAILAAVAWILWRGTRAARVGLLLFAASYLPVSGLVAIPSTPIADRHLYLAALGLSLIAADRLVALASLPRLRRLALPAGAALLLVLAGLSARRATDFHDDLAFWRSVLEVDPDYSLALVCFGNALHESGDLAGAEEAWTAAVRANPYDGTAWNQLGNLSFRRGDLPAAERAFASAAAFRPDLFDHFYNHALALEALGRRDEARAEFTRARAIVPPHRAALAREIDARLSAAPR